MIDSTPDIFLHIMSYFVGPPASTVDAQSIVSMMQVNKRWNELCNLKCFWKTVPKYQRQPGQTLETRLLGYAKLQKSPRHNENCWKVRDRSTDKVLRLEITTLKANAYPKRQLREMAIKEAMTCTHEHDKRHLNLLHDFDQCNGYALHWHNYPDDTLDGYMRNNNLRARPDIIKSVIFQIVHGILCLHDNGLVHGSLVADAIHVFHKDCGDFTLPTIQIANFDRCRDHRILEADNCFQYQDTLPLPEGSDKPTGTAADVYAVGRVFASMLHGESLSELDDIEDVLKSNDLDYIIGTDGVHLLNGLLCPDPTRRISIFDAFQHPYLSNMRENEQPSNHESSCYALQKLKHLQRMEKEYHARQRTPLIRFETHQAAAMVDWLFEIASVFHLNTRTVFLSVGYYNQCCHQSVIRTLLDTTTQVGSEKIQLLAATCLYIASKCEDDFHVQCGNLVFSADRTFHVNDIIGLELKVLNTIEWKLSVPTIYDFVTLYMAAIDIQSESPIFWLSLYISELSLASTMHTEFSPSMVAACALVLSQYSLKTEFVWSTKLELVTGYKWDDLSSCLLALSILLKARHDFQEVSIIDRRYSKLSRMNASETHIRVIDSSLQLEAMRSMVQML
jgi:serine/threonine protein kinase